MSSCVVWLSHVGTKGVPQYGWQVFSQHRTFSFFILIVVAWAQPLRNRAEPYTNSTSHTSRQGSLDSPFSPFCLTAVFTAADHRGRPIQAVAHLGPCQEVACLGP